ncbi:helix-turn-helix domain-containing protein [Kribbella albertanoniae]|uniref:Helix-turn-helix domain-containing protein n=1 Tax=Kribbella albertanoniae TaxID=1266829 RepID=A0A4R4P9N3_9ACTN|nr:helix-turn-helix domain-containing protein [Kribbella albertanoniae]TDC17673.1 helix-turn-helix domain-containing protein [Kribbella albertanoniae]
MSRSRWKMLRERKLAEGFSEPADVADARREIRLSMALAQAVYERRTELGLTQTELAARSGLTQAKISRIEGSDTVPTLPLLARLVQALDATLNIALDDAKTEVSFVAHSTDAA